jgi:catechol 2,3-dioxygenase-like lactoylglutathione lyase family enzyme
MSLSECRIAAVAAVSDLDRSRAFFEGTLGLSAVAPAVTRSSTAAAREPA